MAVRALYSTYTFLGSDSRLVEYYLGIEYRHFPGPLPSITVQLIRKAYTYQTGNDPEVPYTYPNQTK